MYVQVVVYLELHEVAHVLVDAFSARRHLKRTELNLCLALEHRFFYVQRHGSHESVAYVGELVVLAEELLDGSCYMLLESALMGAALCGVLSVHERVILLAILVGMREGDLDVLTLHVYYGVERVGSHRVGEQICQAVAREDAPTVVHNRKT